MTRPAAYNPATMRRIKEIFQLFGAAIVVAGLLAVGLPAAAWADAANGPSLVISQLKITSRDGQFITLYNAADTARDMSQYQLEYFNNYDPDKATSSRLINLSGIVPPHGYFMVSNAALTLCYRMTVDSLSLGFSTTAGMVKVLDSGSNASSSPAVEDYVGWSKTDVPDAQTLPADSDAFLERQPVDEQNNPAIDTAGAGSWQTVQPDAANACGLVSSSDGSVVPAGPNQLLMPVEPLATIVSLNDGYAATTSGAGDLPLADFGLMAPLITELLPNPAGTGNDATDEFIELYNPNEISFDLSGFSLQVGTTALHTYQFPVGASLAPGSFQAFRSAVTRLSLSNVGSQARLLDPAGNSIVSTDSYGAAGDGLAWALANGKWYWTTRPTPGGTNIVVQPPLSSTAKTAKTAATSKSKKQAATAKTKTAKAKTAKAKKTKTKKAPTTLATRQVADKQAAAPIHLWALALVGIAALLYGVYEYRADLANRIHRCRSYLRPGQEGRT